MDESKKKDDEHRFIAGIRCTSVPTKPSDSALQYVCDNCEELIWIEGALTSVIQKYGRDKLTIYCIECAQKIEIPFADKLNQKIYDSLAHMTGVEQEAQIAYMNHRYEESRDKIKTARDQANEL